MMRQQYHKQAGGKGQGRDRQKRRTHSGLVAAAKDLFREGKVPTVTDAAEAADVSRATAYRYFPTQQALLSAVMTTDVDEVLASFDDASTDLHSRVDALVGADYDMRLANETQLRTWVQLSIEQHREGHGDEATIPRGGRIRFIEQALQGVKEDLDAETLRRLSVTLSLLIGTESFLVLKDVWGLEGEDAKELLRWACRAVVDSAVTSSDKDG